MKNLKTFIVKVFNSKNKQVGELEIENAKAPGVRGERELIGFCRVFVNPQARLVEVIEKK